MIRVYENDEVVFEGDAEEFLFGVDDEYTDELEDTLNYLDSQKVGSMISFNYVGSMIGLKYWSIEKIGNIID